MRLLSRPAFVALALAAIIRPCLAATDIEFVQPPTSAELDDLTRELGAALGPAALSPAEPLGAVRVEVGVSGTDTSIDPNASFWKVASGGRVRSGSFVLPRASARLGLPLGLDIGVGYGRVPGTNVRVSSGEVKWAFVKGSSVVPALALRGAYSQMTGVDELDFKASSLDLSISKGIGFFTPYGGIGRLWTRSEVHDIPGFGAFRLKSSPGVNRGFVGARLSAGWFKTFLEYQRAGGVNSYSLKLAFKVP